MTRVFDLEAQRKLLMMYCGIIRRFINTGSLRPRYSGWLGSLLKRKSPEVPLETDVIDGDKEEESPEELLCLIAEEHVTNTDHTSWRTANLGDIDTKGKILCSFERVFNRSIPSQDLGTINTFTDLLAILNSSQYQKLPQEEAAPTMYPNIKDNGTLPPNLSIQFISTAPREKPYRKPFQNYDARRPEHANFLSKQEKERRKQKRRHLTAWK